YPGARLRVKCVRGWPAGRSRSIRSSAAWPWAFIFGLFVSTVVKKPRYVNEDDCTGCRLCEYACSVELPHEFEGNLGMRKAIYVPFSSVIPQVALLDMDNCVLCGRCETACPTGAVDYLQEPEEIVVTAGTIILATGYEMTMEPSSLFR
ncbi:MAG: 4Fe-4S binding protein, partial [Phycisphaerae bacterium]